MTGKLITVENRKVYYIQDNEAEFMVIQLISHEETAAMDQQYELINEHVSLAAVIVDDWNQDLSPWKAEAVFGRQDFGDGAKATLEYITDSLLPYLEKNAGRKLPVILAGYSLAGLFALWSVYQTDIFAACMSASGSMWFKEWIDYAGSNTILTKTVYLSLGDREHRSRNPVMSKVKDCTEKMYEQLKEKGVTCTLEYNPGNHFVDVDKRCARGISWCLEVLRSVAV